MYLEFNVPIFRIVFQDCGSESLDTSLCLFLVVQIVGHKETEIDVKLPN